MHQVKIYDDSGNIKKVISVEELQKRTDMLIESPSLFRKTHGKLKPQGNSKEIRGHGKK